jgi:hypothetical protein
MPLALKQNPELAEWATRHGLDPSRIPVREFDVRPAATREHPRQVRVDYVALLLDNVGSVVGRDARTLLTCDPPPSLHSGQSPTGYPWQTVHHDASVSVDPHPPEPGIVWLQVDVGDRVHIDLELDPDQAAGLLADIERAIVKAQGAAA